VAGDGGQAEGMDEKAPQFQGQGGEKEVEMALQITMTMEDVS
jgi:hypothetical protein